MTGRIPEHAVDILAIDARDDLLEIWGGLDESGFGLSVRSFHRPDLAPDAAFEAKLGGTVAALFDCSLPTIERRTPRPAAAEMYRTFVQRQRHMMSRYR